MGYESCRRSMGEPSVRHQARRFAPLQEKMFKQVERELNDVDEADKWKQVDDDENDDDPFAL